MAPPPPRPISRLLIANRGEIAIRVLQSAREFLSITTYAIYTKDDSTHISLGRPDHAVQIPSPSSYMDIEALIALVKEHKIDAVHPGYGFLSESAEFSHRMWAEAQCIVIGPGAEVLDQTGDKLKAKALATASGVPVLKAMSRSTNNISEVAAFAKSVGYPIMVKATDGGGGRGIRLAVSEDLLQSAVERCIGESPSGSVFAEQAAVEGYKHIEVQIIGDGRGGVKHLWERDCSVQRRFQKIVEVAPAPVARRAVVKSAIEAAVRMARDIRYLGLGTWEFLVNVKERKFFFLEINPRLQVEHTISEQIASADLVRTQLLIAQGLQDPEDASRRLGEWWEAEKPPLASSIQLRVCAEDPKKNFALSIGKVTDVQFPTGNGVRVDSHLSRGGTVGSDFDNMMAKIIITAGTWQDAVLKAQRALADTRIVGVTTNLNLLRGILADKVFLSGNADTKWLETNMVRLVDSGDQIGDAIEAASSALPELKLGSAASSSMMSSATLFRKGEAWSLKLEQGDDKSNAAPGHLKVERVTRNEFPNALVADLSYTVPGAKSVPYKVTLSSTTASADSAASTHRRGDPNNKSHIILPMSGKLIEVLVDEGDEVKENEVIAYVKQMKMELEIRSPKAGQVAWVIEVENDEGDDVAEGTLLVDLTDGPKSKL
jgi:pyruvate carboxylase